jgi:hypothetical protein
LPGLDFLQIGEGGLHAGMIHISFQPHAGPFEWRSACVCQFQQHVGAADPWWRGIEREIDLSLRRIGYRGTAADRQHQRRSDAKPDNAVAKHDESPCVIGSVQYGLFADHSSPRAPIAETPQIANTTRAPSIFGDGWPPAQIQPAIDKPNKTSRNMEMTERTKFMRHLSLMAANLQVR